MLGWIPRNFKILNCVRKLTFLSENHKKDNFWSDFYEFTQYMTVTIWEITLVIISVIFPQTWQLRLKMKILTFLGIQAIYEFHMIWPNRIHIMSFFLEYMFIDRAFQFLALKCYFSWFWNVRKSLSTYHLISSPPRKPFRTQKSSFQK